MSSAGRPSRFYFSLRTLFVVVTTIATTCFAITYCLRHYVNASFGYTPAVAAGLASGTWSVLELLEKVAGY